MKKIDNIKWIEDYSKSVKDFTFDHDPTSHQPFDAFNFYPIYFDLWLDKIHSTILKINKKNLNKAKILKSLPPYGSLKFIVYTIINMGAILDYDQEKIRVILDFFIDNMSSISKEEDLFSEDNIIIRDKGDTKKEIKNLKIIKSDDEKRIISKLIGVLALYNHSLYNDYSTEYGYAIDGPYDLGYGKTLLVRRFQDLKPVDLWPSLKSFNFDNIKIATIYSEVNISMRFVSSHIISTENYQEKLKKYSVFVGNRSIKNLDIVMDIVENIAQKTSEIYLKQKNFNFEETKLMFLKQQGYELKNLFDLAGIDWKPGKDIRNRIKGKKLKRDVAEVDCPKNKKDYEDYIGVTYLKEVYK